MSTRSLNSQIALNDIVLQLKRTHVGEISKRQSMSDLSRMMDEMQRFQFQ
jgi:hypothetical protein